MLFSRALCVAAIGSAACTVPAVANGSAHLGITQPDGTPLPKLVYDVPVITDPIDGPGKTSVIVGALAPVQVAIDPDPANVWEKNFSWDVSNRGVFDGDQINLCEWFEINLNVTPGRPIFDIPMWDWHEHIDVTTTAPVNGKLAFVDGTIEFDFGGGLVTPNPLQVSGNPDGDIWFDWYNSDVGGVHASDGDFDTVIVKITKTIEYQGTGIAPGAIGFLDWRITEYPTPTPGTLLPLAALPVFMRRRR